MKKVTLVIDENLYNSLGLTNAADEAAVATAIKSLATKAGKADELQNKLASAETAKATAENALADYQKQVKQEKVKTLLANALSENKITKEASDAFESDYSGNPEGLEKVLNSLKAYVPMTNQLAKGDQELPEKFKGKTLHDLFNSGDLEEVRANHLEHYKTLYKEQFKKDYTG